MAESCKTSIILTRIFKKYEKTPFDLKVIKYLGTTISGNVVFDYKGKQAYTYADKKKFTIVLGAELIKKICGLGNVINKEQLKERYSEIDTCMFLLFCHELGHNKFTDMVSTAIKEYPKPQFIGFLHTLFNIIEDPVEEIAITNYIKKNHPYDRIPDFNWLVDRLFEGDSYEFRENQENFLNYLLLVLRIGKDKIKNSNPIFEKYKADLLPLIKDCLYESDGTERLHKIIKLGEWIIENIKEFSWEDMPTSGTETSGSRSSLGGSPASIKRIKRSLDKLKDKTDDSSKEETEGGSSSFGVDKGEDGYSSPEEDEETEEDDEIGGGDKEEEDDDDESSVITESSPELDENELEDYFGEGDDIEALKHVTEDVSDKISYNETVVPILQERIDKYSGIINSVAKVFNLLTTWKKPFKETGFTSGKFDIRRAIQSELRRETGLNIWSRQISRGKIPDPVVSIICDNSGSMFGNKAHICCDATLGLSAALEKAHIPFEVWGFTKTLDNLSGTSISLLFKKIEDNFSLKLPWFGLNDSGLAFSYYSNPLDVPLFRGNSEEVNINFIGNDFLKRKETRKIMIVLCDGATTGSRGTLKRIINNLEKKGVIVIGLGIQDRGVEQLYTNHKVFANSEELQNLPEYMIEIIQNYCK